MSTADVNLSLMKTARPEAPSPAPSEPKTGPDPDSQAWLDALRAPDRPTRERAVAHLHELLLRAAHFELHRRRAALIHVRGEELADIAMHAANDALMAVLRKLNVYRGHSRFTTWAYKFALFEVGVRLRRRAWQGREVVLEPESWPLFAGGGPGPDEEAEQRDLVRALGDAIEHKLTPHQREVLVGLALNEVPIDVLADRLNTTRGALYKSLHDARRKLRSELAAAGFSVPAG
jgi:RNA polymerase sigma-70 factor, ECF subfamily